MKRRKFIQSVVAGSFLLSGCGNDDWNSSETAIGNGGPLLNNNPELIVTPQKAVSFGGLRLAARSAAQPQTIPLLGNAVPVDVDALTALTEVRQNLENLDSLQTFFAALGVQRDQTIVVYDDGEMKFAARLRFLLGYCGVAQALLVDGGAAGLASLLPVQGALPTPSSFQAAATPRPIDLVFQQQVIQAATKGSTTKLLDVRTPAEFAGTAVLPGDARPGHIPGAISLPEGEFLNGLQLRSSDEIVARFQQAGLSPIDTIIVYCHDGAKSSLVATLLVQHGFPKVSLYYLSYRDWSENPNLPVTA